MIKILIIEDEYELVKILKSYLVNAGYQVEYSTRGDMGLRLFEEIKPDLVLLDLSLPGMDGIDIAQAIRQSGDTPIIILTARVDESDRILGLEIGADDYVVKPYSPREVVARVKAVLRRSNNGVIDKEKIKVFDIEIDQNTHQVYRRGQEVLLTRMEFELLKVLAAQPGRAFTRIQLLEATQNVVYEGYERTIDAHIKNLRAKLEANPRAPYYIETVFGIGYRFRKESS